MPSFGSRFRLALSLSRTLNLLRTSGRLHKPIRFNIVANFPSGRY